MTSIIKEYAESGKIVLWRFILFAVVLQILVLLFTNLHTKVLYEILQFGKGVFSGTKIIIILGVGFVIFCAFYCLIPAIVLYFLYTLFTSFSLSRNTKLNTRLFVVSSLIFFIYSNYIGTYFQLEQVFGSELFSMVWEEYTIKDIISANITNLYTWNSEFSYFKIVLKILEVIVIILPCNIKSFPFCEECFHKYEDSKVDFFVDNVSSEMLFKHKKSDIDAILGTSISKDDILTNEPSKKKVIRREEKKCKCINHNLTTLVYHVIEEKDGKKDLSYDSTLYENAYILL